MEKLYTSAFRYFFWGGFYYGVGGSMFPQECQIFEENEKMHNHSIKNN